MHIKFRLFFSLLLCSLILSVNGQQAGQPAAPGPYSFNRAPLRPNPYAALPLGAIQPMGWLKEMLLRQASGATGHLDSLYSLVMGKRNGWLGGDGDQWERGPYWLDGLLPLAYILGDKELMAKTRPWIEWAISSQQPDGYFGPAKDYTPEPGLQRDNSHDWWPKIVMLKILQQYYTATGDKRIIKLLTDYFRYQLKELPQHPLDHWSFWARFRAGDNLQVVYWLYNITGDAFLLQLGDLLHRQTFDFTHAFLATQALSATGSLHAVNLAQGMKEPLVYYQHHAEQQYADAVKKGFEDLRRYNGFANGLFSGDESLHGSNPTQGSELCTAVEMMFTLESILAITGDPGYADQLEKIAFNVLPAQVNDAFTSREYFQQPNQVMATRHIRNFDINHSGTDLCYGLLTGYACCTSNMHQGWPKFTQNLWYATPDKGLAALVYAPSKVKAYVADGREISFTEETAYPFEQSIRFTLHTSARQPIAFPFRLRIPAWCTKATVKINGQIQQEAGGNQVIAVNRSWKTGDVLELELPMHVYQNSWYENSLSVERGPLTYALKIAETEKEIQNDKDALEYGASYTELRPGTAWNYALIKTPAPKLEEQYRFQALAPVKDYPWNLENCPVIIQTKGRRIPSWQLYNEMAGPMPVSMMYGVEAAPDKEDIILVPYGCTRLRISEFPVVGDR